MSDERPIIYRPPIYRGKQATITQGDTIREMIIRFDASDGVNLTGALIEMQVYWNNTKRIDISSANNGGITILDSLRFRIDERPHTDPKLPHGVGKGDIQITTSDGKRDTYFTIRYNIEKEYTRS
jgi:hypothetical protein